MVRIAALRVRVDQMSRTRDGKNAGGNRRAHLAFSRVAGDLFLGKGAGVTIVAGKVFVRRVDVKKGVALCVELLQIGAAALGKDRMTGIAVAGFD
jgi:hypothetical protein